MNAPAYIVSIVFGSILLIVALGVIHDMWKTRAKAQAQRDERAEQDEHRELLARLEERIEVLERIVTDEKSELKRRFRNL